MSGGFGASLNVNQLLTQLFGSAPTNTQTSGSGTSKQDTTSNASSVSTGETTGTSSSTTSTSADPAALAAEKASAAYATGQANDPSVAAGILTSVLHKALLSFGANGLGASRGAGLYGSSTEAQLAGEAAGAATADANASILSYKTTEQGIANQANQAVIDATKSSTTTGSTSSTSDQNITSTGTQDTTGATTAKSDSSTQQPGWISIICTELFKQGKLPKSFYKATCVYFQRYPAWGIAGYYLWSMPLVRELKRNPRSLISKVTCYIMNRRVEFTCWKSGVPGARLQLHGWVISTILYNLSAVCGLYLIGKNKVTSILEAGMAIHD